MLSANTLSQYITAEFVVRKYLPQFLHFLRYVFPCMKDWLESYKHNLEENTYDSYCTIVSKIDNYFSGKNITLENLKPIDIQKFYDSLYKKGLSSNTVLHYHANIRLVILITSFYGLRRSEVLGLKWSSIDFEKNTRKKYKKIKKCVAIVILQIMKITFV